MAEQGEERCYRKGFVAFGNNLEVYGVPVEPEGEEGGGCVDGYHEEDSDYTVESQQTKAVEPRAQRTVFARRVFCSLTHASILSSMRIESQSANMLLLL